MHHLTLKAGDRVFVRATALEVWPDAVQVRIEDALLAITLWVPASEVSLRNNIGRLTDPNLVAMAHAE